MRRSLWILGLLTCVVCSGNERSPLEVTADHSVRMQEGLELFKESVRGILSRNCVECHGRDKVEGDVDLSTRASLFESGFVAGRAEDSDLVAAIRHTMEPYMPHKSDQLPLEDIEAIARWIDLGAPYDRPLIESRSGSSEGAMVVTEDDQNYWAYRTLQPVEVPILPGDSWSHNEIDRFIRSTHRERNLNASPRASGRTLIRRAYLNSLGLPPTLEEVAEFVNDLQPGAYERMIDRMLESPFYGERWARHWMDVARFAESSGFEIDFDRPYAYHYRDFLIRAFNQNMPYDRFVSLQAAGDELDPTNPVALAATGFLGAGPFPSVLTEKEFESARYDELDDMVNTFGTAFLGTTLNCARCHDHKYDPIPQKDYYALAAHFTRTVRSYVDYDPHAEAFDHVFGLWLEEKQRLEAKLAELEDGELETAFQNWLEEGDFEIPLERWLVLDPIKVNFLQGVSTEEQWDHSLLLSGPNPEQENETLLVEFETGLLEIQGLRMEALTHPTLPSQGPGRDHEGGFTVNEISVHIQDMGTGESRWMPVALSAAKASAQENDRSLSAGAAINGVTQGWSIDLDHFGKDQAIAIRFKEPVGFEAGTRLRVRVSSGFNIQQMVGRPRFSITLDPGALAVVGEDIPAYAYQGLIKLLVGMEYEKLTDRERSDLRRWYGNELPAWKNLHEAWEMHHWHRPVSAKTRLMVSNDTRPPIWHRSARKGFPSFYENTHYLNRGDVDQKEEVATPGVLQILNRSGVSGRPLSRPRSALAGWLTDVDKGAGSLLARVFVNRVWHHHFGRGIVDTPSDFGTQGGAPSHPQLLEWLAKDFVDHGWDVKRLQRQILTSATYRQDSIASVHTSSEDSDNRYLHHFPPRRLEAEAIRDSLLAVSGILDDTPYGPGTRNPEMNRRSIYFFIKRGALIPELLLFDWPEHLVGIGSRTATTIAPQALQFLNSSQSRRYAEGFAKRLQPLSTDELKIRMAYQWAFSRFPAAHEIDAGLRFLESQKATYLAGGSDSQIAWIDYCQSLLSLNEFIYIR